MTRRQVVLRRVDFPPMLGPVSSIIFELREMLLGMTSSALRQGCFASRRSNPVYTNWGRTPPL
jgi:hypothetical protein